ncbi:MAG TPA: hypothetical protein VGL70_15575 [Candidatus Binatia bacterium]|jgi:hypothetical protein
MSSKFAQVCVAFLVGLQVLAATGGCDYGLRDFSKPPETQKLASVRSRSFETTDREKMLRAVITTLQDLGFIVDRADYEHQSVSGTKLDQYLLRWTVTVLPQGASRLTVRAQARYDVTPVLEPEPYEKFFAALARAVSLEARPSD